MDLRAVNLRSVVLNMRHLGEALSRVWRILRALFQEIIGFLFFVLAGWGALWLVRTFRQFQGNGEALFKMVLVGGFVLMMTIFGISSFRAARRISSGK